MCFEKDCHKDDSTPFLRIGQTLQNSSLHLVKSHNPKSLKIAFFFFSLEIVGNVTFSK